MLALIISHDASRASGLFRVEQLKDREEQEHSTTNGRLHLLADLDLQLCMNLSSSNTHSADYSIGADCRRRYSKRDDVALWLVLTLRSYTYRPLAHEDLQRWRLEGARDSILTNRRSTNSGLR
jgi:hypothetical protein